MYQYNNYNNYRQSNIDWIMVQSIDQVNQVLVQPNQKAWIMVQNAPIFALRTADQLGLTTTELYKFEKYEEKPVETHEYVTREELDKIIAELKEDKHEQSTSNRARKPSDELK